MDTFVEWSTFCHYFTKNWEIPHTNIWDTKSKKKFQWNEECQKVLIISKSCWLHLCYHACLSKLGNLGMTTNRFNIPHTWFQTTTETSFLWSIDTAHKTVEYLWKGRKNQIQLYLQHSWRNYVATLLNWNTSRWRNCSLAIPYVDCKLKQNKMFMTWFYWIS